MATRKSKKKVTTKSPLKPKSQTKPPKQTKEEFVIPADVKIASSQSTLFPQAAGPEHKPTVPTQIRTAAGTGYVLESKTLANVLKVLKAFVSRARKRTSRHDIDKVYVFGPRHICVTDGYASFAIIDLYDDHKMAEGLYWLVENRLIPKYGKGSFMDPYNTPDKFKHNFTVDESKETIMQAMIRQFTLAGVPVDFMKFGKLIETCCNAVELKGNTVEVRHHGKGCDDLIYLIAVGGGFSVEMFLYPLKKKA